MGDGRLAVVAPLGTSRHPDRGWHPWRRFTLVALNARLPSIPAVCGAVIVPLRSTLSCCSSSSLDHFVRAGEDRLRHGQAERLGGAEIDHQLDLHRLLDRQIGWLLALEDPS